jgi:hypothetical protein
MAGPNRLNRHSGRASSLHFPSFALFRETGSHVVTAHGDS